MFTPFLAIKNNPSSLSVHSNAKGIINALTIKRKRQIVINKIRDSLFLTISATNSVNNTWILKVKTAPQTIMKISIPSPGELRSDQPTATTNMTALTQNIFRK